MEGRCTPAEGRATVDDAVALRHRIVDDPNGGVLITTVTPAGLQVAFALNQESDLLEPVNQSLLDLVETRRDAELRARWSATES